MSSELMIAILFMFMTTIVILMAYLAFEIIKKYRNHDKDAQNTQSTEGEIKD